jgi:hypothetical protein
MQLSNETLSILKNFGAINQGIYFRKGKVLKTMTTGKNILAEATLSEEIETEFGIYDLNKFLSVVSLHKDAPSFEFGEKELKIVGQKGRSKISYRFCEPTMINVPPEKQLTMPDPEVSFELSSEDFQWVMRAASVLGSPQLAVESDGSKVSILAFDSSDSSAHTDALEISEGNGDKFRFIFKTEHLQKVLDGAYDVQISSKGISNFKHKNVKLQYWISTETGSTFTKG